jgi:hypothetical protein
MLELGTVKICEDLWRCLQCSQWFSRESLWPRKVAEASRLCSWTMMAR